MSVQERLWWDLLERWSQSYDEGEGNGEIFDWFQCAQELGLSPQRVHEFIDYFANDLVKIETRDVEICLGATCRANGSEIFWQRLAQMNKRRIPEMQICLHASLCLGECDRAPCAREMGRIHTGKSTAWIERLERE